MLKDKHTWYSDNTLKNLNKILKDYSLMDKNQMQISNSKNNIYDEAYKQWLVGFSDGEGSFRMTIRDNNRCTFDFNLHLHTDDSKVLEKVLYVWDSTNKIHKDKSSEARKVNTSSISFGSKDVILEKIIPLFDQYSLLTSKLNDYLLWKEAFLLCQDLTISWDDKKPRILEIKSLLNKPSYSPSNEYIKQHLNMNWIIGFIEAEGSYLIKQQKDLLMVQIAQIDTSETLLEEVVVFLNNLIPDTECNIPINKKVPAKLYKDKNKLRIMFSSLDYIYWIFIPNMLKHNMETKKTLWFVLWAILAILKKHGLIQHPLIREYINHVRLTFNKNSNSGKVLTTSDLPTIETILELLKIVPLYRMDLTHDKNARLNRNPKF